MEHVVPRFRLAAGALAAGLVLAVSAPAHAQAPALPTTRLLVMPFENTSHEGRLYWLSEASAVLLTDDLNAMGSPAITRDERLRAFERLRVPPVPGLSHATVIRVGELVEASAIVIGEFQLDGEDLVMRARAIRLDTGRLVPEIVERGAAADLFAICERVARRIAPATPAPVPPGQVEGIHPPLAAFEHYIKGVLSETPATKEQYLGDTLRIAPAFHPARLALWSVYTEAGEHQKALQTVRGVPDGTAWTRRARFDAARSLIGLGQLGEAFQVLVELQQARPSPGVLSAAGVVQLRRAVAAGSLRATQYFAQALALDPEDADLSFNMGYAAWIEKDLATATQWLRETVRRNPADADAHFVLGAALRAGGATTEAVRERDLAGRLSSRYADRLKRPGGDQVPRGLERMSVEVDLPVGRRVESLLVASEQREQREVAAFHLERGRRLFKREQDRDAALELRRVVYLQPYQAEALRMLGQIHLRGGRVGEAIDTLKVAIWSDDSAAGRAALAEAYLQAKDAAAARIEVERALALDPANEVARRVRDRLTRPPG